MSSLVPLGTGMTANSFDMSQGGDAGKVLFGLVCVVAIAWIYLLAGAGVEMEQMGMGGGKMMLMSPAWRPSYAALVFAMRAIMMVALMLPSAAPAILKPVASPISDRRGWVAFRRRFSSPPGTSWFGPDSASQRHFCSGRSIPRICYQRQWQSAAPWSQACWSFSSGSTS